MPEAPIPCLPALPLVGNVFALRSERLALLTRISQRFGDIGAFHFGPRVVPLLNSPELVYAALVEQSSAFEKTATVCALGSPVIGNGIFLSEGEKHRQHRKQIAPLFQPRHVLRYAETMLDCTMRLQANWQEGETIDLASEMTRLTLWIISDVLFGADVSSAESELGKLLTYTFLHFADAVTNPVRLPQSWPTPHNRRVRSSLARINTTIYQMLARQRVSQEERHDFLSLLLHAQDEEHAFALSEQEMRDEALSLFVAGHETTANALTWSFYLLSQHPEMYARMQAEGDKVLHGRAPTSADLPNLPYTLQVLQETLRLYPPVYAFTRRAVKPVQLGGYSIPQDTSVVISPYTLHRRASLFPHPERFDPERFSPQREQNLARYAYIPFSAGPRICLGMHFALLEGHLILAALTQRLTLELAGSGPIAAEPLLTLRPKGAILMKVKRR
jgi:cytochrome P450